MRLILAACHRGLAAVVVTHDAQLASWADRVVFLRDGRVVDQTLPLESPEARPRRPPEPMSVGVLERPVTGVGPRTDHRRRPGPPGHAPLVLASLQARMAAAVPDPAPDHRRGGGRRGRLGRRGQHAAAGQRRIRHGPRPRNVQPDAHQQVRVDQPADRGGADRRDRARRRHRAGHRQRDVHRPRLDADLSAAVPGSPWTLRRADAAAALRALPDRAERDRPHPRAWRPSSTCRWATRGPRAARPSSASCRTPRACSTSSRSSRRAR